MLYYINEIFMPYYMIWIVQLRIVFYPVYTESVRLKNESLESMVPDHFYYELMRQAYGAAMS